MQRLSFALLLFALQAALLSLFTTASSATNAVRDAEAVQFPDLYEASIAELQDGLNKGHFSSEDLVKVRHACGFHCSPLIPWPNAGLLCQD